MGPFAIIGDDSIGRGIVETLRGHRSRAVLMRNHGPFTIGATPKDAVKAAVMCEDVARTVHLARQGGPLVPIPQDAIDRLYDRYQNVYGQSGDAPTMTARDDAEAAAEAIRPGRAVLGIELGSTRIKACLIGDDPSTVLATGSHAWENELVDGSGPTRSTIGLVRAAGGVRRPGRRCGAAGTTSPLERSRASASRR